MKIFTKIYDWTLKWAEHKFAPRVLAFLTFAESVFYPIPPDVLLAPMVLAKPDKAWRYAAITTIASVVGGVVGYLLGYFMFDAWVQPIITEVGYQDKLDHAISWFEQWGIWVVFLAGFTPIPYKVFTISAGFLQMLFIPFLIASFVGRGLRFYLVAGLMQWGGQSMQDKLRQWIDVIGWAMVILIVLAYLIYQA
ncbi:YqaA family protein [Colwellia sp. MEBiC06753]